MLGLRMTKLVMVYPCILSTCMISQSLEVLLALLGHRQDPLDSSGICPALRDSLLVIKLLLKNNPAQSPLCLGRHIAPFQRICPPVLIQDINFARNFLDKCLRLESIQLILSAPSHLLSLCVNGPLVLLLYSEVLSPLL